MWRLPALLACLALAAALYALAVRTPFPTPETAPATTFSAARAFADVEVIGARPHPVGSPANAEVRDYLVRRLTALGLDVHVQRAIAVEQEPGKPPLYQGGSVENVVGVLRGRSRTSPAVLLMAHYDSVPGSPGAADDGAGVSSALEILRAIKARGTPARDVVVALTDGEEVGMLGARAFFDADPVARRIGFVINMDVGGGGGRTLMYEAGDHPAGALDLYQRAGGGYRALSVFPFVADFLPSDSDYSIARRYGAPGVNFAFIGRAFDYHSPTARPERLDLGSLQGLGDSALGVARAAAFAETLPDRGGGARVYGDVLGFAFVSFPPLAGWLPVLASLGLIGLALRRSRKLGTLAWQDAVRGAGVGFLILTFSATALEFARRICPPETGGHLALLARFNAYEVTLAVMAAAALLFVAIASARGRSYVQIILLAALFGVGSSLFGPINAVGAGLAVAAALLAFSITRALDPAAAWLGILIAALGLGALTQAVAPLAAPIITWPLMIAAIVAALTALGRETGRLVWALAIPLAAAAIAWIGVLFHLVDQALDIAALNGICAWLTALVIWPLIAWRETPAFGLRVANTVMGFGLFFVLWLHFTDPWDDRFPMPAQVLHVTEASTGRSYRVSTLPLNAWSTRALITGGGDISPRRFPGLSSRSLQAAPVRAVAPSPLGITVTTAPDGKVTLTALAPPGHRRFVLDFKTTGPVRASTLQGQGAAFTAGEWNRIGWTSTNAPLVITLDGAQHGTLAIRYAAYRDAWPEGERAPPAIPANVMGVNSSGSSVTVGERRFTW